VVSGRSRKESANSLSSSKSSVNEEYVEAFRTKSYMEIWDKVHGQVGRTSIGRRSSSSVLPDIYEHLSENLLEPRQETLADVIQGMNLHSLLIDFFGASLEACKICELLLQTVHQTRANYQKIKRVIKLSRSVKDSVDYTGDQCKAIFGELAAYAQLKNPLSNISPVTFRDLRDGHVGLFRRLTTKHRKIKRKARSRRIWNRVGGISLVVSHSVVLIMLLIFAIHSTVGVLAAPALLACSVGVSAKKMKMGCGGLKTRLLEKHGEQLDVAARGVYILINDFDTMSRLVWRLHDEVEHCQAAAGICVKNGRCEILKEVVGEFLVNESRFMEQLEELEEHIYLCFLTINRSRRLVFQEIIGSPP
jgi:hypothetical protein